MTVEIANKEAHLANFSALLEALGENPAREGLKKTALRHIEALEFLTKGYKEDIPSILGKALYTESYQDMVLIKNIEFYSMCEHHVIPFFGKIHVAYIPDGKVIGLSKIPRLVDAFARRLQVQEKLTRQIAEALWEHFKPRGVGVVCEAYHLCMMMRGVEKQDSYTITSSLHGDFKEGNTRQEFLNLIQKRPPL